MRKRGISELLLLFGLSIILTNCQGTKTDKKTKQPDEVTIQIAADPGMLHPVNFQTNFAGQIIGQLVQTLASIDFKNPNEVPVLVKSRPKIEDLIEEPFKGGVKLTYELRTEAKWDNGTPVTVDDILFSLKAIMNPLSQASKLQPLFEEIDSIDVDKTNNRIFTLYNRNKTINTEECNGSIPILPEYYYDPNHLLKKYSLSYVKSEKNAKAIKDNPDFIKFNESFNSEKMSGVNTCGSGAYKLKEYLPGQRVVLERKKSWWADKYMTENTAMEAYPDKLTYKVINDPAAVITELKAGKIDVCAQIAAKDFVELSKDTAFTKKYFCYSPPDLTYCFIAMNNKNPILSDVKVRKALTQVADIDNYINKVMYGLAFPTTSMQHPDNTSDYNSEIKRLDFSIDAAKKLLDEAGWKDANGDGIREKKINGKLTPLKLTLLVNKGNPSRAQMAEIFKSDAAKAGIDIDVQIIELNLMNKNVVGHDYELSFFAMQSVPMRTDPKGNWHTESAKGGFNVLNFGDAASDRLIDSIRTELNDEKRIVLFKKFQQMVYDRMPCIFLYAYKGRVIINKRFTNAEAYKLRPGYNEAGFKLKEE